MKCPHCNNTLSFISPVEAYCRVYDSTPKGVTRCCGNIVQIRRVVIFDAWIPHNHEELETDDWGNEKIIKK